MAQLMHNVQFGRSTEFKTKIQFACVFSVYIYLKQTWHTCTVDVYEGKHRPTTSTNSLNYFKNKCISAVALIYFQPNYNHILL